MSWRWIRREQGPEGEDDASAGPAQPPVAGFDTDAAEPAEKHDGGFRGDGTVSPDLALYLRLS